MPEWSDLWFATSNSHKYLEARMALRGFKIRLRRLPTKGTEIQSDDIRDIASRAALETFRMVRKPLVAEDSGLFIEGLGGFPGAYAAYAYRTLGPEAILTLLEGKGRRAEFRSAVAYRGDEVKSRVFLGSLKGRIAREARGTNGFGFDPVFIPSGAKRTLAEMTTAEKVALSHRSRAFQALGRWYTSNHSRQPLSA